jgi:hypothetical protein
MLIAFYVEAAMVRQKNIIQISKDKKRIENAKLLRRNDNKKNKF